ncbi:MAG TPA: hypothetical protein VHI10_10080 [Mycobacterium sp.]|nr:hypothetical protein [Mycobacterium sp.]
MVTTSAPTGDDVTRASDLQQAAYFRGALADHRALIAAEIARQTRKLNALSTRTDALTITRLRRDIRANEAECRNIDRMIEALDHRFASLRANQS